MTYASYHTITCFFNLLSLSLSLRRNRTKKSAFSRFLYETLLSYKKSWQILIRYPSVEIHTKDRIGIAHNDHLQNNMLATRQTSGTLNPWDNFVFDKLHGPPPPPPRGNIRLDALSGKEGEGGEKKNGDEGEKGGGNRRR